MLPGATHLLHLQNPGGMAAGLAGFFARHPLPAAADAAGATRWRRHPAAGRLR